MSRKKGRLTANIATNSSSSLVAGDALYDSCHLMFETLSSSGVDGLASETKSSHSNLIKIWTYLPMYSQSSSSSSSSSSKLIRLNPLGGNFSLANFNCSLRGLGVPSSLRGLKVLCSRFLRPGVINGVLVHKLFGSTNSVGSNSMSSITLPFSTFFRRAGITRGVLLLFAPALSKIFKLA
ncbi:hypothetical protein GQX74_007953 [Glossina fuscipes]|nr:hypothetical protein GQX74_007953 [Glossina fuscipes]